METHKLKFLLPLILLILLSSCTKLMYTSLDVLRPAKVAFDKDANNLLIVNNSIAQPVEFGHHNYLYDKEPYGVALSTDSLSIFCLGALAEDIEGKDFFSSVQLQPATINTGTNFDNVYPLSKETVKSLCLSHKANVILSLDKIKVLDDLTESFFQETNTYLSTLELSFETSWSIHYLNDPRVSKVQFKDTVYWESESYIRKKSIGDLPKRVDALVDGALNVGHKTVDRFIPYWDKVDRYLFSTNNKYMKLGMDSVFVRNWTSAISNWEKAYTDTKSDLTQAQAANNMAIGYEILGDMDKALEYANISFYSFGKLNLIDYDTLMRIQQYIVELKERKDEIQLLKKQLAD